MSEARPEDTVREDDLDADGFGYWPKEAQDAILRREAALAALVAERDTLREALDMLWRYYLLPISYEQKAQVKAALAAARESDKEPGQ